MKVVKAGLLTTVQDLGRRGYQKVGVGPAGAMDAFSLLLANMLVDNAEDAAALEITLRGPVVEFTSDALVATCGAALTPTIADVDLPHRRAVAVRRGSVMTLGAVSSGCRGYLAVAGGIDVPVVMGSRSTHVRTRIGGHEGRALRDGDEVTIGAPSVTARSIIAETLAASGPLPFAVTDRSIVRDDPRPPPPSSQVRCVCGPHFDDLPDEDKRRFLGDDFEVSVQADRMGYRLVGPRLPPGPQRDLLSSAVTTGAIQLPPNGQPIVLMVERQTTGGYPVIAQVITADLPLVAQLKPGDQISFAEVGIAEAHEALRDVHGSLTALRKEVDARA